MRTGEPRLPAGTFWLRDRLQSSQVNKIVLIRIIGILVLFSLIIGSALAYKFAESRVAWFVPVGEARLEINGIASKEMRVYRATKNRTMVLIRRKVNENQTYVMLGPGPGHLPESFTGRIRRCESVFAATPFFGFADEEAECAAPANKRDENRDAVFSPRSIEFIDDDGNRVRLIW